MKKVWQKIKSQGFLTEDDVRFLLDERYDECRMLPVVLAYRGADWPDGRVDAKCIVMMKDLLHMVHLMWLGGEETPTGSIHIVTIKAGGTEDFVKLWEAKGS